MLKKITVEAALNAEMEEHLGCVKHAKSVVKIVVTAERLNG
jgi:putative transposase